MNSPKFVRPLTSEEQEEVERLVRANDDTRVMRRAQMVRLSAKGNKPSEIAEITAVSIPTVHRIIDLFNKEGLAALPDKPRQGRPAKVTDSYIKCLKEAVAASPRDLGYVFGAWTLERLREHLARTCNVILNPDYLSRLMAKHGIVYRRPRHVMGHLRNDTEYDEKKEVLAFLKKSALGSANDFDLLFLDECEVHLHPTLSKAWGIPGPTDRGACRRHQPQALSLRSAELSHRPGPLSGSSEKEFAPVQRISEPAF